MRRIVQVGAAAAAVAAAVVMGSGGAAAAVGALSVSSTGDDGPDTPDVPLSGDALDRASRAALAHTGGGTVTETEVGDDGAAYGVEIRKPDGSQVEVELSDAFAVTGEEADDDR